MSVPSPNRTSEIRTTVARYYADCLRTYGATPRGVDWNSAESQELRFAKLLAIAEGIRPLRLIDFGCGYGALADRLREWPAPVAYQGFDVSETMVEHARALHADIPWCSFAADSAALVPTDFVVASGIFNVKLEFSDAEWRPYVLDTLDAMNRLATHGFAFNLLSTCSDVSRRRRDLHYADPLELFDWCKRRFSPFVALLHDYPLFEFTLLVRKRHG